jgi:hypothetical protein
MCLSHPPMSSKILLWTVNNSQILNHSAGSTLPTHLSPFQNLFLHSSSVHFQPSCVRITGAIIITDICQTVLCLSASFCAVLIFPYAVTVHLYQLAVNFREGNVTPIKTKSPYKLLHRTKYPNSMQLYTILLLNTSVHHLLHAAPTTSATFYIKNMLDLTPKWQEREPNLLNLPYCCTNCSYL